MGKERIILAFIAIVTGAIVALSLFSFYQQKKSSGAAENSMAQTPSTTPKADSLTIESPANESITDKKSADVKGKTEAGALVVIATAGEDFVLTAGNDGQFSQKIAIGPGENGITVTAFPENGTGITRELTITYNDEEF